MRWMNLEPIIQSEVSQKEKDKYCILTHIHSSVGKESACNAEDPSLIPGLGRSPGEGIGYPLQYSCLKNPRDGGAWWAAIYWVAQSQTRLK